MKKNTRVPMQGHWYITKDNLSQIKVLDYNKDKDMITYQTTSNDIRTANVERFRSLIAKYELK